MTKILGLILELNPFHNGHLYFINKIKEKVKPACTIAVLSGNYTMRGDLSVIDKFTKTSLLLTAGIDIVLELPFVSAVNSADYFAGNAVNTLGELAITDIGFGVETDDAHKLNWMKDIIDNPEFNLLLHQHLKKGLSYPAGCLQALKHFTNDHDIIESFTLPNNTLAIQYLRALKQTGKPIKTTLIKRIANNYYDETITGKLASATALRKLLRKNENISSYVPAFCQNVSYINPEKAEKNLLYLLKYNFIHRDNNYFQNILGINEGIENRFAAFLDQATDYQQFIKRMQTKRYTANKIKRLILHIILNTDKTYENTFRHYVRMLGAGPKGLSYIRSMPKTIKNNIITTLKHHDDIMVTTEYRASRLYDLITDKSLAVNEFKIPIIGGKNEYETY